MSNFADKNDKQAIEERGTECRYASAEIRGRFDHVLPEVQEAGLHGVHEDLAGLHYGLFHYGSHRLLHQTCLHSHQQYHSLLNAMLWMDALFVKCESKNNVR